MSPVIDCTTEDARAEAVARAAAAVRDGRLVVMPTDTVYGIGADAFNAAAVTAVLAAKGRGREMPPAVLVSSPHTVDGLAAEVPGYARQLMKAFWPGPLTLILRAHASLMWDLGETNGTVGLRMPDDAVALALLAQTGPMAVSSANRTGAPPAASVLDAATMFGPAVEVYLDAGPARGAVASTIVDCTKDEPVILRQGVLPESEIRRAAGLEHPSSESMPATES
ncbi:L-threonylcarbamoyladenylate synthase [Austwickia chelonae]|uniref:L-threonylcarbamoyladenylate synthase n=1 Tax=Austwickia chelonae TaxID=100225 RepID=UPI000E24AB5E|nr:L-threonylcarbamoyladenylate synthase [Austwickia chelonae]